MSKGGSSTSVQIPKYIEDAAKRNLNRADKISALGSVPLSFGPTVAAFTDPQVASFNNTADTASAFGLNSPGQFNAAGATDYGNGLMAYSAMPLYNATMDEFAAARPGQKSYIDSFFIDPFTGASGYNMGNAIDYETYGYTDAPESGTDINIDNSSNFAGGTNNVSGGSSTVEPVNIDVPYTVPTVYVDDTKEDENENKAPFIGEDEFDPDGDDNFLPPGEVKKNVDVIKEVIDDPEYDPKTDVIFGTDKFDEYTNDPEAQLAADTIYNNNQVIYGPETGNNITSLTTGGNNWSNVVDENGNKLTMEEQINAQSDAYADTGVQFDMNDPSTWISAETAYNQPETVTYDGSSEKNSQVASILKDQYGWSDQQLIDGGYEGYAPAPEPTLTDTLTDIVTASPTVQIIDSLLNPDVTTDADLFNDSFTAASADAAINPTGTTKPATYNDDPTDDTVEFANTVLGSDDISTFLPPSSNNDDGPQGIVGNNDTGSNNIFQSIANTLTPGDGQEYVDGVLVNTGATVNAMNSDDDDSNDTGSDKIVCTEMYRQTKLDDWTAAMKTWYVYQRRHLTPYHQVGYHAVFRPFVKGMRRSKFITKIGAYAATKRTQHLRYVLTRGKAPDSIVGRLLCKLLEPPLYVVGRAVSAFRKDA